VTLPVARDSFALSDGTEGFVARKHSAGQIPVARKHTNAGRLVANRSSLPCGLTDESGAIEELWHFAWVRDQQTISSIIIRG
jgi:hypothetical protein